jgi:dolichyl-diphosphooligosaccharide--protein glycosyltransferase
VIELGGELVAIALGVADAARRAAWGRGRAMRYRARVEFRAGPRGAEKRELVDGGHRRWVRIAAPPALFALAFAVRALPCQSVLIGGHPLFFGSDVYYHMRRIVYSIVRFPAALGFDPYVNFPDGGRAIWTPLFDWTIAALMRPLWGPLSPVQLERLAIWIPPLLGALTVVALYYLAQRHFGTAVALVAGLVLSVLSAHFWYSQVGFIDHHAAVALVSTLVLAAAMALLARASREPSNLRSGARNAVASGGSMALALLLWPGSLLHVGLVEVGLLAFLLARSRREDAIGFARLLALLHGVAFVLIFPFGAGSTWPQWSRFSPVVLSAFQPWYFGAATLFSAACAVCWRHPRVGGTRASRGLAALAIAAALLGVSAWLFPGLPYAAGDAWEWFAKRDSFQAQVAESSPLFFSGGQFTLAVTLVRLSIFALLLPVALCVAVGAARGHRHRAPVLLFLWWTLGLSTVTVFQKRFFNSASVAISLLMALSVCWVYAKLPPAVIRRSWTRRLAKGVLALVTLFLLLPVLGSYWPYVANLIGRLEDRPIAVPAATRKQLAVVQMANWLRIHTPETSGWLDPTVRPEYGILAPWTIGHVLEYEARRPTVTDNFGDDIGRKNYLLARRYYQSEEEAAADLLDRLGVRYVVSQYAPDYLGEDPVPGSMFFSLFRHDGSAFEPPPNPQRQPPIRALARHRMIYESAPLMHTEPPGDSLYKVFEYVAGARVVGRAAPGERIRATLPVRTNRRRRFTYTTDAVASAAGRYELRLPYANSGGPAGVRAGPHYTLECRGASARVSVDERAVTTGARIEGPALCPAS